MEGLSRSSWTALPQALARLLTDRFGVALASTPSAGDHPALAWRRAGLMNVTGRPDGPGRVPPVPLTTLADASLEVLRILSASTRLPASGALLLGERSRLLGLARSGDISANRSCRLLAATDGLLAINLPRDDDWSLAGAMVQTDVGDWDALAAFVRTWPRETLVERGRVLGLALAADRPAARLAAPFDATAFPQAQGPRTGAPLVVDLTSLWAGPLAGSLLAMAGARVTKVESTTRPDGGRGGHPGFFDLLNGDKQSAIFDFRDETDLARLRDLIGAADIVIEGSRPRALRALGVDAEREAARGAVWLSITGHGRHDPAADWIGYGDDAAVAGGLTSAMRANCGETMFVGDAIADPLTGLLAAAAGWAAWNGGGGQLISLALAEVVAFACTFAASAAEAHDWQVMAEADDADLYALRSHPAK
ncbi:CoA transferase [Sphingomonas sp. BIUV-7]|uniref:CoA transferase n=1 Tax=Sphingomonas natans TaxID=3063330 RepID=A0ABT8YAA2_9SPHN|nr:CoA transferase [Sphingomonas sp. BIUV-7]MDO6414585.1 CoA transferase [Sphingomonas sp. BIUV-7]